MPNFSSLAGLEVANTTILGVGVKKQNQAAAELCQAQSSLQFISGHFSKLQAELTSAQFSLEPFFLAIPRVENVNPQKTLGLKLCWVVVSIVR